MMLFLGIGEALKIVIIAKAAFIPMVLNTAAGIHGIPPGYAEVARVPAAAVAPEMPQQPLSTSTTFAPLVAAAMAAQVPAGPPPITSTSASWSTVAGLIGSPHSVSIELSRVLRG